MSASTGTPSARKRCGTRVIMQTLWKIRQLASRWLYSPPHHSRIEPFCRAIAPLLAKPLPTLEVVNDLTKS